MVLKLEVTEVRVCVWNTVWVIELFLVVSVLLRRTPMTESPSARLVKSPVDALLEVLEVEDSGETMVDDAAALLKVSVMEELGETMVDDAAALLKVSVMEELGETMGDDAAALGLGDVTEEDDAAEGDGCGVELEGVEQVEQVDVVVRGGDVVAE